jgi:pentatricopeptide repeat protein
VRNEKIFGRARFLMQPPGAWKTSIILTLPLLLLAWSNAAFAADDAVTRAMKLYEKRHYAEAASLLRAELPSLEQGRQGSANLALGMIYLKNAVLHRELYQSATAASQEYLKKLAATQGPARSRFVDLYLGDVLAETGKAGVAAIYLEKFSGLDTIEPRYRSIARICLGLCSFQNKDVQKAKALWESVDASDPEVKAELAAAYSRAALADRDPAKMLEELLGVMKQAGKQPSMRMIKNMLTVYARSGQTELGLELLKRADLKSFSYRENLGNTKIITFYDPSLLGDAATLYGRASIAFLEKAGADAASRDPAAFSLAQAHALFGSPDQSAKAAALALASSQLPQQYKDRVRVWQGANLYLKNQAAEAAGVWEELSRKQPGDPDLIAEILFACGRLRIECPKTVQQAVAVVEAGEGRKFSTLNAAVGKYYLGKQDLARAASYLEAGRDKSNKNKIESNDPVTLVSLADAYFRTKKFSEALEIYFEMSKQFPEVRQIQEAMQGVYAMEHKSAGDVKIN